MGRLRKIAYISGTRADYGLMSDLLKFLDNDPQLSVEVIATGMHLQEEFGNTVEEIKSDGFKTKEINCTFKNDDKSATVDFISCFLKQLNNYFSQIRPDIILTIGDRPEVLTAAIVGSYLSIPVAHLHGGDISSTADEHARHAISKLAHIHFPATQESANRLVKMGEKKDTVITAGAPGLTFLNNSDYILSRQEIQQQLDIHLEKDYLLVLQHSVSQEVSEAENDITTTLEALSETGYQSIVIYPNSDAGGRQIIEVIQRYSKHPKINSFPNINRRLFLSLMKHASIYLGNSSSGIIEAPALGTPVINIGTRQDGRQTYGKVITVDYDKKHIVTAIKQLMNEKNDEAFKNPYLTYNTLEIVRDTLLNINLDTNLLQKQNSY